jgi:hypothetical protein
MRRVLALLLLAIALAPACKEKDNTKIVVAVWSDLAVPIELDTVRIDVSGPTQTGSKTFLLTSGSEAGKTMLPAQLELVPLGEKNATFTVKAVGLRSQAEIVSQTARVSFVSGQALLLKLFLGRDCKGKTCPTEYTCAAGACDQPIAVVNLPPYEPGKPLSPPDAGARIDSGTGLDSGPTIDSKGSESLAPDLRAVDTGSIDVGADAALDVPITSTGTGGAGGSGGAGGTAGLDGPSGSGGAPGIDAHPIDSVAADTIDAPLGGAGGAGGAIVDAGSGGTTGTGGIGGTGGTGGATGGGGATGTGGTGMEVCVFGTSRFGNCKFGP